jgi:hypothetical protein
VPFLLGPAFLRRSAPACLKTRYTEAGLTATTPSSLGSYWPTALEGVASLFWTGSEHTDTPGQFWFVDYYYGYVGFSAADTTNEVRCGGEAQGGVRSRGEFRSCDRQPLQNPPFVDA